MTSHEIASADSLLRENAELRRRVLEWEDCYDRLAGAFDLHLAIGECQAALSDYAGVFYDVVLGETARELAMLRELAVDVARWRETGGDPRDMAYILETMDKIEVRAT